jgi:glycosyltransferase involved in cell wall biosynthesis
MRIYYVNRLLVQYHSAPGLWGRKLLYGLRQTGAVVSSYPAISDTTDITGTNPDKAPTRPDSIGRFRSFLRSCYSRRWVSRLAETWMMVRGIAHTIRGTLWVLWHRHQIEADVVLGRQAEYEATSQFVAMLLGQPLVLEVHSIHFIERQIRGNRSSRLLRAVECWQWRRASRIWVNSDRLKAIITENGIPEDIVRVISFGADLERFATRKRAEVGDTDEIRVVFVGSFFAWHGAEILLHAFAAALEQAGNLRLILIGDGARRKACESLAQELGIAEFAEFTGWISNDQVIEHLGRADIGVAPYLAIEPFYFDPAKIIEYMAAGLAVLASNQGRIPDQVENGVSGLLLPPGDEAALAAALLRLANDKTLREHLGDTARQRAEVLYNWPETCKKVLSLCTESANTDTTSRN